MSTVRHPAFPEVTRDVDDVARWVAAGWVHDKPQEPVEGEPGDVEDE